MSPVPSRNLPLVSRWQEEHFLPGPLTCPKPFLRPRAPKAVLVVAAPEPVCLVCQSFVLYIYLFGRQNRLPTAPTDQVWVAFFSFFLYA